MSQPKHRFLYFISILLLLLFCTNALLAIPAFARRYKISCTTCHDPFPRLKDYGDEFAGDGFIIPEEERDRDYVSAGDQLLWLNKSFPLAVRFEGFAAYTDQDATQSDLQLPWGVKLLSGGTLYKNIGYYFYFYASERGEVAGLEDAYIHFNDVFGSDLDIMTGQFQVCDPLMKRELRMTFEDYNAYKWRIGESRTNLAYDKGIILAYGIEQTGTDLVAMLVNGNGIPEAGENHFFDNDKYKNIGLRVAQGIGDIASVGGFYYYGNETDTLNVKNTIQYYGPDIVLSYDRFTLTGQYLLRSDSNPLFAVNANEVQTHGIVGELIYAPKYDRSRAYYTLLYNSIDSDIDEHDYQTVALSGTYLLARNLRLIGEYIYDLNNAKYHFVVGLIAGF